ncbi:hypothetical protein KFU94_12875 [Chloroflexi bacterium TSY]|nr:hypothetical protein [Chloroflexi bacterium TSY]MBV7328310.1 hypothetical protein [Chloroflexi bacterium TSY]MBV7329122.1 hypothetical protein [Chloroflexi bacterium TSY]
MPKTGTHHRDSSLTACAIPHNGDGRSAAHHIDPLDGVQTAHTACDGRCWLTSDPPFCFRLVVPMSPHFLLITTSETAWGWG